MKDQDYTIKQLCNHPAFKKWARGQEGPDVEKIEKWIAESEENRKIVIRAQKKITGIRFKNSELPDLDTEWAKVKQDIKKERLGKRFPKNIHNKKSSGRFWNYIFKIAAVLLLGAFIGLSLVIFQKPFNENEQEVTIETIETDFNDRKTLILPEGSKIVLGANSRLSYKSNWLKQEVLRVNLSGEAYFSISPAKTKANPKFVVETIDGSTSVWGTKFTVNSNKSGTQVTLEKGEVRFNATSKIDSDGGAITMEPGEMASYNPKSQKIEVKKVNPRVYTSWINNELYFDKTPFSVLVDRMERTYGLDVKVEDPDILTTKLSGTIDFKNIDELIQAVSDVMDITIKKKDEALVVTTNHNNKGK